MRDFEGSDAGNGGTERGKDSGVTRREFLELGVAATVAAGAEKLTWAAEKKSRWWGWAATTSATRRMSRKASASYERRSTTASIFWTTAGTTTAATAKCAWAR